MVSSFTDGNYSWYRGRWRVAALPYFDELEHDEGGLSVRGVKGEGRLSEE
jgi:hypothetical protein